MPLFGSANGWRSPTVFRVPKSFMTGGSQKMMPDGWTARIASETCSKNGCRKPLSNTGQPRGTAHVGHCVPGQGSFITSYPITFGFDPRRAATCAHASAYAAQRPNEFVQMLSNTRPTAGVK